MQYWWPRQQLTQFYAELAEGPAQTIVLGEVTCSRRNEFSFNDWLALGRDLQACGKTVRLATMPLLMSEAELRTLRRSVEQEEFEIEAGDAAALQAWSRLPITQRRPLVLGPHLNIYSASALPGASDGARHQRLGTSHGALAGRHRSHQSAGTRADSSDRGFWLRPYAPGVSQHAVSPRATTD